MNETRIVTLLASATEIVCALGYEGSLVGRSHECDFPRSVEALPACTASKIDTDAASRDIDGQVKSIVEQGLSVYAVDGILLKDLAPDVIVTQTQCEVCAASPKDLERALADWTGTAPDIISLEPNALDDIWNDIRAVAEALGDPQAGDRLVDGIRSRMTAIEVEARRQSTQPTIACVEWFDPLMAAGNWVPELVAMAGGRDVLGRAGEHSPWITWEALAATDPDVILVLPCGYDIGKTRHDLPALTGQPGWPDLRAVKAGRVHIADGNQYFNRPGPRLAESLEILAEVLHPGLFQYGHEGTGRQTV